MASSASILLSKRIKPTPLEPPAGPADQKQTGAPFTLQVSDKGLLSIFKDPTQINNDIMVHSVKEAKKVINCKVF